MELKALIKEMIPPFFWRLMPSVIEKSCKAVKRNRTIYLSYQKALQDCITRHGYEDDKVVRVVFEKTKVFVDKLLKADPLPINSTEAFSLLPFLRINSARDLRIIDLGGACGAHYFYTRKILGFSRMLKWHVVETKAMCEYGKRLENTELTFSDNFEGALREIGRLDVLFTSGTLQCVENPYDFLVHIVNSGAEFILFNRLGLTEGNTDVITTHTSMLSENGIGPLPDGFVDTEVEYPFSFIQKTRFDSIVKEKYDYKIVWSDPTGIFPVNDEPIIGMGLLCERKKIT